MQLTIGTTMSLHWGFGFLGAAMVLLGAYDGYKSYFTKVGTTNFNRAVFGSLTGAGLFLVSVTIPIFQT